MQVLRTERETRAVGKSTELADAFVTASRALVSLAVRTIDDAPVDVTVTQHRVLVLLASRGALTIGDIAEGLAVNERRREEVDRVLGRMTSSETAGILAALHAFNRAADELEDGDWASSLW